MSEAILRAIAKKLGVMICKGCNEVIEDTPVSAHYVPDELVGLYHQRCWGTNSNEKEPQG